MISIDLISKVLGLKVYSVRQKNDSTLEYTFDSIGETRTGTINVYELTYKCKEWARNKYHKRIMSESAGSCYIMESDDLYFYDTLESESVFKACKYILDNKKEIYHD
jgi:hypothetical protein